MREEQRDPKTLRPGDPHYSAYVGPPGPYDFTGATQFSLLFTLGLRAHHRVLDFGCGSLRAGRLLLPYLDPGNYFGVEPNRWLIDDAIRNEIGEDLVRIKRPTFDHNDRFRADCFDVQFDFIVAQSVFSHAGPEVVARSLRSFKRTVRPDGLIAATFVEGDRDYRGDAQYPKLVTYTRRTIKQLAAETELALLRIPWFHPRQTWYLLAADNARLPPKGTLRFLRGTPMSTATDDEEAPMGKGRQKPRSRSASEPSDPAMRTGGKRPKDQVQAQRPADWHRRAVGGLWEELGELQVSYLKEEGLQPDNYLLDVGCGSLRAGVRFVDYLEPGHYFGLDINQGLLDAGMAELKQLDLHRKRPQLRCSASFEVDAFDQQFDFAIAQSLFTHLPLNKIMVCMCKVAAVMRVGGSFYATFFENPGGTRTLGKVKQQGEKGELWTSPDDDPYHYGLDAFEWLCEAVPLEVEYVGDWQHPYNQKMLRFTRLG